MAETVQTPDSAKTAAAKAAGTTESGVNNDMVVIDMGRQESSRVRKLRRGEGRLLRKVKGVIAELRNHDQIEGNAQVVLVVVRESSDLEDWFDDDDDDDDDDD